MPIMPPTDGTYPTEALVPLNPKAEYLRDQCGSLLFDPGSAYPDCRNHYEIVWKLWHWVPLVVGIVVFAGVIYVKRKAIEDIFIDLSAFLIKGMRRIAKCAGNVKSHIAGVKTRIVETADKPTNDKSRTRKRVSRRRAH